MMKKTLLSLILFTVALFSYATNVVPQEDAQLAAKNFMNEVCIEREPFSLSDFTLQRVITDAENTPLFYHFQIKDLGFIFISATDLLDPVFAFSLESNYHYEMKSIGSSMFFEQYKDDVKTIRKNPASASPTAGEQWAHYTAADFVPTATKASAIEPLITTKWNQGKYYNQYCPFDNRESADYDQRTVVGCVALNMLNIMYYYRFPERGLIGAGYYHPVYGIDSVQIANFTYNYATITDNDLNHYTEDLARLVKHSGTTVQMRYDLVANDGSGAVSEIVGPRMETHWGFYPTKFITYAEDFESNATKWRDTLRTVLSQYQPLYYSGTSSENAGHAFIVDGFYNNTQFHVNWGGGGYNNGFFAIPLDNSGTYLNNQAAYLILHPSPAAIEKPATSFTRLTAVRGSVCDGAGNVGYAANSFREWVIAVSDASSYKLTPKKIKLIPDDNITIYAYNNGVLSPTPLAIWSRSYLMPDAGNYYGAGNQLPSTLTVNADSVLIRFVSFNDTVASIEYNGFNINYEALLNTNQYCNRTNYVRDDYGTINDQSPDGKSYIPETTCQWTFMQNDATKIKYRFTKFELGKGDVIDVYSNILGTNTTELLYRFDQYNMPDLNVDYSHYGTRLQIHFNVDNWIEGGGFSIDYEIDKAKSALDPNTSMSNLAIFPNPVSNQLNIKYSLDSEEVISYQIFDITGKIILSESTTQAAGNVEHHIPVHHLAKGFYVLRISTSKDQIPHKFVVN